MAVDINNLSPYQRLMAYLYPDTSNTTALQQLQTDTQRLRARERLEGALQGRNGENPAHVVGELAREFAPQILEPYKIKPEDVVLNFQESQNIPEQPSEQQRQPQQQAPQWTDTLTQWIKQKGPEPARGHIGDTASIPLRSIQERELLQEFNTALDKGDTEAINKLLETRLEAPELLKDQWEIANKHIDILKENNKLTTIDAEKLREQLVQQRDKQIVRLQKTLNTDKGKQQQQKTQELTQQIKTALSSGSKGKAVATQTFQGLLSQQLAFTENFTIFEEYELQDKDLLLLQFARAFNTSMQQMQLERLAQEQELEQGAATTEGSMIRQQANNRIQLFNRVRQITNNGTNNQPGQPSLITQARQKVSKAVKKKIKEWAIKLAFTTPPYVGWWIVGIILAILAILALIIIVVIIVIAIINQQNQQPTPIPGLTITLDTVPSGQKTFANGQNIPFVIDVTYTGTYSIDIIDQNPNNATVVPGSASGQNVNNNNQIFWSLDNNTPLPDSTPSQKHWRFALTFSQVGKDLVFHNVVIAQYAPGSGPSLGSTNTTTANTSTQQVPTIGGYCSPSNLAKYFGSTDAGNIASCICKYESGGDPGSVNDSCVRGKTADWSVGLFQINLDTNPQRCPGAFSQVGKVCSISSTPIILDGCTANLKNPTTNINAAVGIYQAGHGWNSGWHAEKGKCF